MTAEEWKDFKRWLWRRLDDVSNLDHNSPGFKGIVFVLWFLLGMITFIALLGQSIKGDELYVWPKIFIGWLLFYPIAIPVTIGTKRVLKSGNQAVIDARRSRRPRRKIR